MICPPTFNKLRECQLPQLIGGNNMETTAQRIKRLEAHIKDLMEWLQYYLDEGDYGMARNKARELVNETETLEYLKGGE